MDDAKNESRVTPQVLERFRSVQQFITRQSHPSLLDEWAEKLYFAEVDGLLHVEFYGSPYEESFEAFSSLLMDATVAAILRSLAFRGPDEGANGTRNWDFSRLLESGVVFPNLTSLFVEPTTPEHHNQTIVGPVYDEEGQIGRFLAKTPVLQSLTVPCAPNSSFFQQGTRPLALLRVDTGYDHQNFVQNLSRSACFPELRLLDFGDYSQRYINYPAACTPFEHYVQLATSPPFAPVRKLVLRNTVLTPDQVQQLRDARPDVTLRLVQCYGEYVR